MTENHNNLEKLPPGNMNLGPKNHHTELVSQEGGSYTSNFEKQTKLAFLREWRRIIYRHKWLILSIVLVALPFVVVQAYRAKSIYQATTTIEVRRDANSLLKTSDVFYFDSYDNTKAEAFIIKSQPVLKKAVVNLRLDQDPRFLDVVKQRSALEALLALRGGSKAKQQLAEEESDKDGSDEKGADGEPAVEPKQERVESRQERERLAPYIRVLNDNLKVDGVRDTRLLKISFTHTDPGIAASVVNGVADSFMTYNFQTKTERFTNTSNWLEESTRKLKAQVEEAEQKLANYSRENNIFSLEGKENLTAEKLVRLHDQAMRAETDRILKQSLYEEVKQGRVEQLPEAFADPKTAELKKALSELAVIASQLSVKFGAKHPKLIEIQQQMKTLQEQISSNRGSLEEKLKADYERAVREEGSLRAALDRAKSEAVHQNQASIQYSVLQQDLSTAKTLYTDFLNKTSQANIQRAEQFNNVRLIETAEPPRAPIGPNRLQTILIGFFLSLAFGVGLAYTLEHLNTTIRNVEDVSRITQLPTLAVIPTLSHPAKRNGQQALKNGNAEESNDPSLDISAVPDLVHSAKDFSAAAEAYRMLRTSILLSTAGRPPKTILVTSGQPGDGKTTTVFNIAMAFTQLNSRVVILDCDMRKPRIHKIAKLKKDDGLSTLLSRGGDLDKLIKLTPVPHLDVIPCGHIPPNPSELISSNKMKELLNVLGERYDYIFIDSPPLITVTDPVILSTLVDGVILVTKSGKSKSDLLRRASQDLCGVGAKILGVVLNDLDIKREGYDYYYYYRYYSDYTDHGKANGANA